MISSKSKEERSKSSEQHDLRSLLLKLSKSYLMVMESKSWTKYWFSQGQRKEHLHGMREIQFREASADTERIEYNTNGIKTGRSKNIDLLKVKRRHSWIQRSKMIQQQSPVNHCQKCTKRKIIASKQDLFRWIKKHFSSILRGFNLLKIVSDLRVRLECYGSYESFEF